VRLGAWSMRMGVAGPRAIKTGNAWFNVMTEKPNDTETEQD